MTNPPLISIFPKNTGLQIRLRISCAMNSVIGINFDLKVELLIRIITDTIIKKYRTPHTGANIQSGGAKLGLLRV